jgi:hypothetical protein
MHVVVRKYATTPEYVDRVRPQLAQLEETMRTLPGFVAYYFVETADGVTTITVTEDETGTAASMGQASTWMNENTQGHGLAAPGVTRGHTLISATR